METGILRPGRWGYSLELDGGGVWQLDVAGSARRYLGRRVTVEGTRSGFDLLDVHRMMVADELAGRPTGRLRAIMAFLLSQR